LEAAYGARKVEIAPRLADHFERSNDHARALRYLLIAVGVARLRFASRAAMEHLVAALSLLVRLPEDDQRRRLELELRLALGTALGNIHGFASEHVRQNYERAAALCSSAGSPRQLFAILYARWYAHLIRAERHGAMSTAAELDQLAQRLRSAEHRLVTTSVLLWTAVVDGRFADAQHLMQRRLTHRKGSWGGLAPAFGPEPVLVAATRSALALWFLGHPERAQTTACSAVQRGREIGHLVTLTAVLTEAALVYLLCRNAAVGRELAEQATSLSAKHGFTFWNAVATVTNGWGLIQQRHASRGSTTIAAALSAMQATGTRYFSAFAHAFLAEGHLRSGELANGLAAVDAGLALAESSLDRAFAPELWRLKGELLVRRSNGERSKPSAGAPTGERHGPETLAQAEVCFRRALELAGAAKARALEL